MVGDGTFTNEDGQTVEADIDGDGGQANRDIDQAMTVCVNVPTSGPDFEAALKKVADNHKASLPFFVSEAQAIEMARPIIAEFLVMFGPIA